MAAARSWTRLLCNNTLGWDWDNLYWWNYVALNDEPYTEHGDSILSMWSISLLLLILTYQMRIARLSSILVHASIVHDVYNHQWPYARTRHMSKHKDKWLMNWCNCAIIYPFYVIKIVILINAALIIMEYKKEIKLIFNRISSSTQNERKKKWKSKRQNAIIYRFGLQNKQQRPSLIVIIPFFSL